MKVEHLVMLGAGVGILVFFIFMFLTVAISPKKETAGDRKNPAGPETDPRKTRVTTVIPKKPWWKKWWICLPVIIIIATLLYLGFTALFPEYGFLLSEETNGQISLFVNSVGWPTILLTLFAIVVGLMILNAILSSEKGRGLLGKIIFLAVALWLFVWAWKELRGDSNHDKVLKTIVSHPGEMEIKVKTSGFLGIAFPPGTPGGSSSGQWRRALYGLKDEETGSFNRRPVSLFCEKGDDQFTIYPDDPPGFENLLPEGRQILKIRAILPEDMQDNATYKLTLVTWWEEWGEEGK
jgi:hypothetical protein